MAGYGEASSRFVFSTTHSNSIILYLRLIFPRQNFVFCRVCVGQASYALCPRYMSIKSMELTFHRLTLHLYGVSIIQTPFLYSMAGTSKFFNLLYYTSY